MSAGEGAVPWRMPILGQRDMLKALAEPVRHRHDPIALAHRERAARAEIILDIDDKQKVALFGAHDRTLVYRCRGVIHKRLRSSWPRLSRPSTSFPAPSLDVDGRDSAFGRPAFAEAKTPRLRAGRPGHDAK
jgi:hypothetical protein